MRVVSQLISYVLWLERTLMLFWLMRQRSMGREVLNWYSHTKNPTLRLYLILRCVGPALALCLFFDRAGLW